MAGQSCDDVVLLWLRNPRFIWLCQRQNLPMPEQPEGVLTLAKIADGRYAVTRVETTTGASLGGGMVEARGGRLALPTPAVSRSATAKLEREP